MNISRPKPETAKKNVFSISPLYYFFKYLCYRQDTNNQLYCSMVYYEAMIYYKQIINSVRLTKMKFLLHDNFNALLNLTECNAHVVTRIEANASLGLNDCQDRKFLLAQIRSRKLEQKNCGFFTNYCFFLFDRSPELSK